MRILLFIHISKDQHLPIFKHRNTLLKVITSTNVTIIFGSTGSGKSTQITQIIYENNDSTQGLICCTQPRRIAAISLATRVAKERNSLVGNLVGYAVRFEENLSQKTVIKYVTDGLLIKDSSADPFLSAYFCIILDEAHERTINTDLLLGICKKILFLRPTFKLIVTSATLELKKFSFYYNKCPVFIIPGKLYKINIFYLKNFQFNYLTTAFNTIIKILENTSIGDILVFLTGKNEIDFISNIVNALIIKNKKITNLSIYPLYSNIEITKQIKIFQKCPCYLRKCILSTNIAETSLTIPGIKFVIDNGYCKTKFFDVIHKTEMLTIIPISKSAADQRSGRAGRIGNGKCFRLYTEFMYQNEMKRAPIPEIKRIKLTDMILMLKSLQYINIDDFDFFERPQFKSVNFALEELYKLKAIKKDGSISDLGIILAYFPIDVKMGKSLIASIPLKCLIEVVIIIGLISENHNLLDLGLTKTPCLEKFKSSFGDHLSLLRIYKFWIKERYSTQWCKQFGVSSFGLFQARKISKQILNILKKFQLSISCLDSSKIKICKSFSSGYFFNSAKRIKYDIYQINKYKNNYKILSFCNNTTEYPKWIIYHEIRNHGKEFLYIVCKTKLKWISRYFIL